MKKQMFHRTLICLLALATSSTALQSKNFSTHRQISSAESVYYSVTGFGVRINDPAYLNDAVFNILAADWKADFIVIGNSVDKDIALTLGAEYSLEIVSEGSAAFDDSQVLGEITAEGEDALLAGEISYIRREGTVKFKDAASSNPVNGWSALDLTEKGGKARAYLRGENYTPHLKGETAVNWDFEDGTTQNWYSSNVNLSVEKAETNALKWNWQYMSEWDWNDSGIISYKPPAGGVDISGVKWVYFDYYLEKDKIDDHGLLVGTFDLSTTKDGWLGVEQSCASLNWGVDVGNGLLKYSCLVRTENNQGAGSRISEEGSGSILQGDGSLNFRIFGISDVRYNGAVYLDNVQFLKTIPEITPRVEVDYNEETGKYTLPVTTGLPLLSINTDDPNGLMCHDTQLPASLNLSQTGDYDEIDVPAGNKFTIKSRGSSSSTMFPKLGYQIKFNKKTDVLGMGEAKKWILISNYSDKSLMRNELAYSLSAWLYEQDGSMPFSIEFRNVDLILNGEYLGTYMLCEKSEIYEGRVDVGDEGFLLEFDQHGDEELYVDAYEPNIGLKICIKEPEPEDVDEAVREQTFKDISAYTLKAAEATRGNSYAEVEKYLDVDSFIDWYIIEEIMMNWDSNNNSGYFYANSTNDKFVAGPVWDFDGSIGNGGSGDYANMSKNYTDDVIGIDKTWISGWAMRGSSGNNWIKDLFKFPEFTEKLSSRYTKLIDAGLENKVEEVVSKLYNELETSQKLDQQRWQSMGLAMWPRTDFVHSDFKNEATNLLVNVTSHLKWMCYELYKGDSPLPKVNISATAQNGTISGGGAYDLGSYGVYLKATPNGGYKFEGWYYKDGTAYGAKTEQIELCAKRDLELVAKFVSENPVEEPDGECFSLEPNYKNFTVYLKDESGAALKTAIFEDYKKVSGDLEFETGMHFKEPLTAGQFYEIAPVFDDGIREYCMQVGSYDSDFSAMVSTNGSQPASILIFADKTIRCNSQNSQRVLMRYSYELMEYQIASETNDVSVWVDSESNIKVKTTSQPSAVSVFASHSTTEGVTNFVIANGEKIISPTGEYSFSIADLKENIRGDVNDDEILSIADLLLTKQIIVKSAEIVSKADINFDDAVNVSDAIYFKRLIAKWDSIEKDYGYSRLNDVYLIQNRELLQIN